MSLKLLSPDARFKTRSLTLQMATTYPWDFLEGQSNKWESQRGNCTSKAGRHYQMQTDVWNGLDIFHEWITIDFRDKLSQGNPRVSGGGQVDRDRTGKMSSRKISGKWASVGTRLKRLRRTGRAGGIVSPNASLTRDEPGNRNQDARFYG